MLLPTLYFFNLTNAIPNAVKTKITAMVPKIQPKVTGSLNIAIYFSRTSEHRSHNVSSFSEVNFQQRGHFAFEAM